MTRVETAAASQPMASGQPPVSNQPPTSGQTEPQPRRGRRLNPVIVAFGLSVALFIVGELLAPGFASYSHIINVLRIASFLGIIAAGQTLVILAGGEGVDLSIGAVVTFGAIIASRTIGGADNMVLIGSLQAIGLGFALGAVNGLGIAFLRIPPLVMTLGMASVVRGILLVFTQGRPQGRAAPMLNALVSGKTIFGIPGILWIWLAIGIIMYVMLQHTAFGRRVYGIGTRRETAYLSGVNVKATIVLVYGLSGLIAAIGGVLLLGYTTTVFLNLGDSYMLPSVAAVVVGGTTLAGGMGGYIGTIAGALVLTLLQSILTTLNMAEAGRLVVYGIVLLVLLSAYGRQRGLRQ